MTWRTDLAGLVSAFDDATAARVETHTIATPYTYKLASTAASGGIPAIPSAWQAIPHGAPHVPAPAVIPVFVDRLTTRGLLAVGGGGYTYGLTYLTAFGETKVVNTATHVLGASKNAVEIALPTYPNSTYNPITGVGIYRSKIGAAGSLYPIGQIINPRIGGFLDEMGDDQMQTTTTDPASDTSGLNVLGSPNTPVSVNGPLAAGGSGQWTEVPHGTAPSTEQYSVDYLSDPNGGVVTFSSADNGKVVTITYTAAIALTAPFVNSVIAPLSTLGGLAIGQSLNSIGPALGKSSTVWEILGTGSITTHGGTRIRIDVDADVDFTAGAGNTFIGADLFLDGTGVSTGATNGSSTAGYLWGSRGSPPNFSHVHLSYTSSVVSATSHAAALGYRILNPGGTNTVNFTNIVVHLTEII